jgi:hypothetical protein
MYLTRYQLEVIINTARPLHDDLVRSLACQLLAAEGRIAELETRIEALASEAFQYAQNGAAINLARIMNLDKIHERPGGALPPRRARGYRPVLDPQLANEEP